MMETAHTLLETELRPFSANGHFLLVRLAAGVGIEFQ